MELLTLFLIVVALAPGSNDLNSNFIPEINASPCLPKPRYTFSGVGKGLETGKLFDVVSNPLLCRAEAPSRVSAWKYIDRSNFTWKEIRTAHTA
jgi:hypothetical protein